MRRFRLGVAAAALAIACALPKVEIDPSLADAGATGGTGAGGSSGSAGKGSSGKAGMGPLGGSAGADDGDARELACGEYCMTYEDNCGDSEANTYDDLGDCLTTCFSSDWPLGTDPGEVNSVQCRVVHAHLAADAQVPHCLHSAEVPMGTSCAVR